MSGRPERATIEEKMGVAVNSGRLEHRTGETPITRVGALGAAALHIHHGADRARVPVAVQLARPAHAPDPQDALAAELASLIVHIRFGRQHDQVPRAVRVFAAYMGFRGRFAGIADAAELLPRLAARALHEYLSDHCPRCGGTGRLEQTSNGTLVRGTGRMARNAIFRTCPQHSGCGGSGKPTPSHTARRVALGISIERYDAERWGSHVAAAIAWLQRMQYRVKSPLTVQLKDDKTQA